MTNKLEKQFFDTFGIEPIKKQESELVAIGENIRGLKRAEKPFYEYPQITDRILLELICLKNTYLWETHMSTVNELKNILLNKYIEHVNLMADENEKQEYINQVRALFEEGNKNDR